MRWIRRRWKTFVFAATIAAAAGVEAYVLFAPTSTVDAFGSRSLVVPLAPGEAVGQTFRPPLDGVESVDVVFWSTAAASADITCRLLGWAPHGVSDGSGSWAGIYDWQTTLTLPQGQSWQHFSFTPIDPSSNLVYQFQVRQIRVRPAGGGAAAPAVGLLASEEPWDGGNLIVGEEQLIDRHLFFQARTASEFVLAHQRAGPNLPATLRPFRLQLGLLTLLNIALAVFAYELVISGPDRGGL